MKYYIADLHLGHENAMRKFDKRPFETLEEMDSAIIANINKVVKADDELFLLGDCTWYSPEKTYELLSQIKCKNLYLILGNHDKFCKDGKCRKLFKEITEYKKVIDNGRNVILCHYPIAVWDQNHNGSYHLYGHVHGNMNGSKVRHTILRHKEMRNAFNVGCMMPYMGYTPRTLDELIRFELNYYLLEGNNA